MKRIFLLLSVSVLFLTPILAQKNKNKKKLSAEEAQQVLSKINMDTATLLSIAAKNACGCIDSVSNAQNDKSKKMAGIAACIDQQAEMYQMSVKLFGSLTNSNNKIVIETDKNSNEYKEYYYTLERWLKDSCAVMNKMIATNDETNEKSLSDNSQATDAYDKGNEFLRKEDYEGGIPWFEKAVAIDSQFAFAWDNLGICYRKTANYDQAEMAYKNSLRVDPQGRTPLQNLPMVYLLQNKEDEAIGAYNNILQYYPDDPEAYYGVGLVYFSSKKDMENALRNVCKAYNIYVKQQSPYRSDAEKMINMIYVQMKKDNKEDIFGAILKENKITPNK